MRRRARNAPGGRAKRLTPYTKYTIIPLARKVFGQHFRIKKPRFFHVQELFHRKAHLPRRHHRRAVRRAHLRFRARRVRRLSDQAGRGAHTAAPLLSGGDPRAVRRVHPCQPRLPLPRLRSDDRAACNARRRRLHLLHRRGVPQICRQGRRRTQDRAGRHLPHPVQCVCHPRRHRLFVQRGRRCDHRRVLADLRLLPAHRDSLGDRPRHARLLLCDGD